MSIRPGRRRVGMAASATVVRDRLIGIFFGVRAWRRCACWRPRASASAAYVMGDGQIYRPVISRISRSVKPN